MGTAGGPTAGGKGGAKEKEEHFKIEFINLIDPLI